MFIIKSFKRSFAKPLRAINIDQTPALRFGVNKYGFLRSDRDLLLAAAAANDEKQVRDIMEMAMQSNVKNPANAGMNDSQLLDSLVPRWVQSPGDFRTFAKELASKYSFAEPTERVDPPITKDEPVVESPKSE